MHQCSKVAIGFETMHQAPSDEHQVYKYLGELHLAPMFFYIAIQTITSPFW